MGFAGVGCYWKLYEKIKLNDGAYPLEEALSWARRDFSNQKIKKVIFDFNLFAVDELNMIHCVPEDAAPVHDSIDNTVKSDAKNDEQTQNLQKSDTENDEQTQPNTPARKEEKDKKDKREKGIGRVRQLLTLAATPEEQKFYQEMLDKFPNVCKLDDPLTYDEYLRIKKWNPDCDVGGLLQAMQNFRPLNKKYRSAYLTLKNWVKRE